MIELFIVLGIVLLLAIHAAISEFRRMRNHERIARRIIGLKRPNPWR